MNHKLESRLPRDSNNLRYADDATLMTEREKELKILLMRFKKRTMKKLFHNSTLKNKKKKKPEIMTSGSITSWKIEGEKVETVTDFISLGSKSLWMVTVAMKLRHLLPRRKAMTNLDSILKCGDITLLRKVH